MKKDISKDVPKDTGAPVSSVRSYFTKDIHEQIAGMSVKEMESTMKDLVTTRHWIALLKYTSMRIPLLDAALRATDPIKDPSKISWSQGAMAGVSDIESYVIELNSPKPEASAEEEDNVQARPDGVIIG